MLISGDAYRVSRDASGRQEGSGDVGLVLKHAWIVDEATAFGLEFGVKLRTARDGLGSGRADSTVNTIFSRDLGRVHIDLNLNATQLGAHEPGSSRTQIGAAAAFSTPIDAHWSVVGELSGNRRSGARQGRQVLAAITYSPNPRLTFDLGVARTPQPSPAATQWFAGVVFPLAKLWQGVRRRAARR